MAINPNVDFVAGAILTAAQQNRFPRGVMATASSSTNYVLTTGTVIATGMSVTFTAVAGRNYRINYYEPQGATGTVSGAFITTSIRVTNAAGTQLQSAILQTNSTTLINGTIKTEYVGTLSPAGTIVIVGCASSSTLTGAPVLNRSATAPAQITVEDIGTA